MSQMTGGDLWQAKAVAELADLFEREASVESVILIGTGVSRSDRDVFSDVDLVVIVEESALPGFTDTVDWLAAFGCVYAHAVWQTGEFPTLRVYFDDGRRVDFLFVGSQEVSRFMAWPKNPMRFGAETIYSRIPLPEAPPTWPELPPVGCPSRDAIQTMANDFRFKCMLAVSKVARDDLVVATHLCLELLRDCVAVALLVRDKETGRDHHRGGDGYNGLIDDLPVIAQPGDAATLLNVIEQATRFFDGLARVLCADYRPAGEPLRRWTEFARRHRGIR